MSAKLIVALDVDNIKTAENLIGSLIKYADIYKIGSYLFTTYGPEIIEMVHRKGGKVFLDLKYHDIPSTVANAVSEATKKKVWGLTIHASGGFTMLKEAAKAAEKTAQELKITKPLVVGVTVLTSLQEKDLKELGLNRKVEKQVKRLAVIATDAGLDGVVASGQEIETVRKKCGKHFIIVTPGIRPKFAGLNDQKRVMTPAEAIEKGADYLVIGRPIIEANDPLEAARQIISEIENG